MEERVGGSVSVEKREKRRKRRKGNEILWILLDFCGKGFCRSECGLGYDVGGCSVVLSWRGFGLLVRGGHE
jgi:hypothetical protein